MKAIKRIIIWSATALLIESIAFFAVDRYYKFSLLDTKTTEVKVIEKKKPIKNISTYIPSDSTDVNVSYDGKYISYYENNEFLVINTNDGTKHIVSADKNSSEVYNRWLPDIDSMILCETQLKRTSVVKFYTYNADNNIKQAPTDTHNNAIELELNNTKDKIEDIELSTAMGDFYVKTLKNNNDNDIFFNDVNGGTSSILSSNNIGTIKIFKSKPGLVYEDLDNNEIKTTEKKKALYIGAAILLNTDNNNNIYIGITDNDNIAKILYGTTEKSVADWKSISLDAPVNKNNIYVTDDGKIYINNTSEHCISEKISNKKINYTGTLLKITNKDIIYVNNGKLMKKNIS